MRMRVIINYPKFFPLSVIVFGALLLSACTPHLYAGKSDTQTVSKYFFQPAKKDIQLENALRRKWGAPVIVDLNDDGYPEVLVTDHGFTVKLYWNENGKFQKGTDIIVGDTHGLAVGDFNKDKLDDIFLARGGGSGANTRNAKRVTIGPQRGITEAAEFSAPLKKMRGRTAELLDADNDGDLDLILLGLWQKEGDPNGESLLYENNGEGQFIFHSFLAPTKGNGQKLLVSDINLDGNSDLIIYGNGAAKTLMGRGDLSFEDKAGDVLPINSGNVTSMAEIDYDNDGDFDLLVARGEEPKANTVLFDPTSKTFAFYTKRSAFPATELLLGEEFKLSNYQAGWPKKRIYIGESALPYPIKGEQHKGISINLVSSEALGWPDQRQQEGIYIGYIGNDQWRFEVTTTQATSGVIHGVMSSVESTKETPIQAQLFENRAGVFIEATHQFDISPTGNHSGLAVADFDNNGYQDVFLLQRGNLVTPTRHLLYLNEGKNGFKLNAEHGIQSNELGALGMGASVLDYNLDGKVDLIFGNERGYWHLLKNTYADRQNPNHTLIKVGSSPSVKASPIGALLTLNACGTAYTRRVASDSAPYSQGANTATHFGLGRCNSIDSIEVRWPNGEKASIKQAQINQLILIP